MLNILRLAPGRLRYWERLGLVRPRRERGRLCYALHDLVALRTVIRLTTERVPATRLRKALQTASDDATFIKKPLHERRLEASAGRIVEARHGVLIEPATGQRVIDLHGRLVEADVHELWSVETLLTAAIRADNADDAEAAVSLYRIVIDRAPDRVEARVNLGTLEFKRGNLEASEVSYRQALAIDPQNPMLLFNLANVLDERGYPAEALQHLLAAVALEPHDGDIRFNLALLLDNLGRPADAQVQWQAYLEVDPHSEWAMLARHHLARNQGDDRRMAQVIPLRRRRGS